MLTKQKFQEKIGKRIKEIREEKGISLKDFESRDNAIDRADLSRIENGHKAPALYTLYRIASILEVDLIEIFKK